MLSFRERKWILFLSLRHTRHIESRRHETAAFTGTRVVYSVTKYRGALFVALKSRWASTNVYILASDFDTLIHFDENYLYMLFTPLLLIARESFRLPRLFLVIAHCSSIYYFIEIGGFYISWLEIKIIWYWRVDRYDFWCAPIIESDSIRSGILEFGRYFLDISPGAKSNISLFLNGAISHHIIISKYSWRIIHS